MDLDSAISLVPRIGTAVTLIAGISVFCYRTFRELAREVRSDREQTAKVEAAEREFEKRPTETEAVAQLTRAKLEQYINKNIGQINAIFMLTMTVMVFGFGLVGYGVYRGFTADVPTKLYASVLSALSGVLISFLGGTFLMLYRSITAQAKDYVEMLERINIITLSIGLPDREMAKELLSACSQKPIRTARKPKAIGSAGN